MLGLSRRLLKILFSIPVEETSYVRRGFHIGAPEIQARLERVGQFFLHGYHEALADREAGELTVELDRVELEFRGFAFEGAAMALTLLDRVWPLRRRRLKSFLESQDGLHIYMTYVGAGWVLGRLPLNAGRFLSRLDPLLGWLAIDGYGFHEGYFHPQRSFSRQAVPRRLTGYAPRAFDQGIGRSLWFVECADVARIALTIEDFPSRRRPDLWSGVGLACAYAGGVDRQSLESLSAISGPHLPHLAQGVAFAAKTRKQAGNPAPHTQLACEVICGLSMDAMADITDASLKALPAKRSEPDYEVWRERIRMHFRKEAAII